MIDLLSRSRPSRRAILRGSIAAGIGMAAVRVVRADETLPAKGKSLRLAHLTDMHVKPEAQKGAGYALALKSLEKLSPRPELIITGGDHVMDVLQSTRQRADVQWNLYHNLLKDNTDLPVHPVIGNHDVFAWSTKTPTPESEPGYGKALYLDQQKLPSSYYSFNAGGWHFIILDNIAKRGGGYYGNLDDAQLAWLKGDLEKTGSGTPICVISHIPIISICAFFFDTTERDYFKAGDNLMHHNPKPLVKLLKQYNTKVAISGHIHLLDRVEYLGMTFICDGAVSGAWWGGPMQETPEGYGVFDFHPDGTFGHQYATYGWKAKRA